jgi:DNA-binding GntR family transcriptional regulator
MVSGPISGSRQVKDSGISETDVLLSEKAYRHLEEAIVTMSLAPGALLSETQLARELGIGRTPVREALQRLSIDGLVTVLPKRGVLVSEISAQSQLRLLEVRRVVEALMVELAAGRASPAERAGFASLANRFRASGEKLMELDFMRTDREFNLYVAEVCNNDYCARFMQSVHGLSRRFFFRYRAIADLRTTASNHSDVASAIAGGNREGGRDALHRLMDHNHEFTMRALRD